MTHLPPNSSIPLVGRKDNDNEARDKDRGRRSSRDKIVARDRQTAQWENLQEKAVSRLRIVAIGIAALHLLSLLLDLANQLLGFSRPENLLGKNITTIVVITLSLLIYLLARWSKDHQTTLDIALVYEVAVSFGIAFSIHLTPWPPEDVIHYQLVRHVSWVCIWIIIFPLLCPCTPGKAALAAFSAATMGPIALMITVMAGNPRPATSTMLYLFIPNYISAVLALVCSRIVYRLETGIREAIDLGNYRLVELIGRGGMGEVWRAEHRLLARPSAIKLIRSELRQGEHETILKRFEREARAIALLRSPHTIEIYDFGLSEDGSFYYVMELLEGIDADDLVQRYGPLPPERVVYVLIQVCRSLADAHHQGLIHRDVKPSNIYICCPGLQYDFVKVLDFGLVKLTTGSGDPHLTTEDHIPGTPAYMAPEMATEGASVDGRTDIYALGCVGYWLLTGVCVFEAKDPVQLALKHLHEQPVPPSRYQREIPLALEKVILSCLAKDPRDRPQTMQQLSADLAACELDTWTQERAEHWWSALG